MNELVRITTVLSDTAISRKFDKLQVQYSSAKYPATRCGVCEYFLKPNGCVLVRGVIYATGWCGLFMPEVVPCDLVDVKK